MADSLDPSRVPKPLSAPLEAAREQTIAALTRAFEQGALTVDEYDERLELAASARNPAELTVLVRDVPVSAALTTQAVGGADIETVNRTFGRENRQGAWRVAKRTYVRSVLGHVRLDLGQAVWPSDTIEVICTPIFGEVLVRIPPDTEVRINATVFLGSIDNRLQPTGAAKTKLLTVGGRAIFGSIRLETAYPTGIGRT